MHGGRDLPLARWGPYSKHYAGYSHVLRDDEGAMVDIVPLVGRDRGRTIVPDVNFESSYHVTAALPDLSYVRYRYQLRWKDVETADVEFVRHDSDVVCRITYTNEGEQPVTSVTSLMSVFRPLEQAGLDLPEGCAWIGGEEYAHLRPADDTIGWASGEHYEGNETVRQLRLGKDGLRKGVTASPLFVGQLGLGTVPQSEAVHGVSANRTFVFTPGTVVRYDLSSRAGRAAGPQTVRLRYRMQGIDRIALAVRSGEARADVELRDGSAGVGPGAGHANAADAIPNGAEAPECSLSAPVELDPSAGGLTVEVTALEAGDEPFFALDGLVVGPATELDHDPGDWFATRTGPPRFTWERVEGRPGVLLESNHAPRYRIYLESADERPVPPPPYSDATITHVYHGELAGTAIERKLSNDSLFNWYHVNCTIEGNGGNHFLGYNLGPFVIEPGERQVVDVAICADRADPADLRARAAALLTGADRIVAEARTAYGAFDAIEAPSEWSFGVRTLRHYTVSNVTCPIRIGEELVRTYTPGRRWGGLFTWDSGMHGIGLTEYAPERAASILDQYLPRSEFDEVPVVLHGTPLPLHVYLLGEIARHEPDVDLVRRYFRRALLYWSYFAGLHPDSTYDEGHVGMLCSYSDGYNSLGVDDYPVQHYEGTAGLYGRVKTVSTTAHAIRTAKILRDLASLVGESAGDTVAELTARIDYLSEGLRKHSWNPATGWFEHVLTDTLEPVLTPDGRSYNMGFDGVAPLVAGICTDEQRRALVDHVMSEREMWTPHGITAVSQAAPYFRTDGYWNGKVWIPHQWFLWKAMITEGEFDHAATIATTALRVFDRAARASYCSWELFDSRSGMGEGCHQFGGLSAPLAAFHNAYFRAGRFTPGFDTLVVGLSGEHHVDLVSPAAGRLRGVLCVPPGAVPEADGQPLEPSPAVGNVYRLDRPGTRCRLAWTS
ncbi:MAG: MGH1-like glycoside hydrolase domain-containing protein [Spirochaetota bacterium]